MLRKNTLLADVPHLIMIIQNNVLDSGDVFSGITIDKSWLKDILTWKSEIGPRFQITDKQLRGVWCRKATRFFGSSIIT